MKVELHQIVADCPSCHGTDFEPADGKLGLIASQTPMICSECGTRTLYIQLLIQIGDKAIERSTQTLDRIKAQRAQIRGNVKVPKEE